MGLVIRVAFAAECATMFGCHTLRCPAGLRLFLGVCGLTAAAACHSTDAATPTSAAKTIVFVTGPPTGAYNPLGTALADVYARTIPGVHFTAVAADGPTGAASNAAWLEQGKADLAFSRSDIAYLAFRNGVPEDARPYGHLRSMAVLYTNVVHIMVRRDSGIRRAEDIRGHRVQMPEDPTASRLTLLVLEALGLTPQDVQVRPLLPGAGGSMALRDAEVRVFAAAYPLASIEASGPPGGIRLLSLTPEAVDHLRSAFPFFKPATIPKGTYTDQDDDLITVGIDGLLLCRDDLPEALVYEMTRSLFDALPSLARSQPSARLINVNRAPTTPIPLHPGAARYYRERDLFR